MRAKEPASKFHQQRTAEGETSDSLREMTANHSGKQNLSIWLKSQTSVFRQDPPQSLHSPRSISTPPFHDLPVLMRADDRDSVFTSPDRPSPSLPSHRASSLASHLLPPQILEPSLTDTLPPRGFNQSIAADLATPSHRNFAFGQISLVGGDAPSLQQGLCGVAADLVFQSGGISTLKRQLKNGYQLSVTAGWFTKVQLIMAHEECLHEMKPETERSVNPSPIRQDSQTAISPLPKAQDLNPMKISCTPNMLELGTSSLDTQVVNTAEYFDPKDTAFNTASTVIEIGANHLRQQANRSMLAPYLYPKIDPQISIATKAFSTTAIDLGVHLNVNASSALLHSSCSHATTLSAVPNREQQGLETNAKKSLPPLISQSPAATRKNQRLGSGNGAARPSNLRSRLLVFAGFSGVANDIQKSVTGPVLIGHTARPVLSYEQLPASSHLTDDAQLLCDTKHHLVQPEQHVGNRGRLITLSGWNDPLTASILGPVFPIDRQRVSSKNIVNAVLEQGNLVITNIRSQEKSDTVAIPTSPHLRTITHDVSVNTPPTQSNETFHSAMRKPRETTKKTSGPQKQRPRRARHPQMIRDNLSCLTCPSSQTIGRDLPKKNLAA